MTTAANFSDRRRLLRLETLYDLALALYAERQEQDLLEELLGRVCLVLDPAVAVAVTRDATTGSRALALVGWPGREPTSFRRTCFGGWSPCRSPGCPPRTSPRTAAALAST